MKKTNKQQDRPFFKTSYEDAVWLNSQSISVNILWREAAMADPYGKWEPLTTSLPISTFRAARKQIQKYGAFEFAAKQSRSDRRITEEWEVRNLHGAYTDYYLKIGAENSAGIAENSAGIAENSAGIAENSAGKSSETLSLVQPCSSLRSIEDIKEEQTEDLSHTLSKNRSSHSGEEAPLRVASPSAPSAKTSQGKSGASLVSKKVEPDLLHRISTNQDGASRFVQKTPPEVEDSAAPHVTPRQNDTRSHEDAREAALPSKQTNPANGQATYPSGAYSAESNRIIDAFLERLPFQYQEQAEDFFRNPQAIALFDQNLTCDVENALKVVTRYIEKKSVDNLGGLINKAIAQGWKPRPAQPAQPPAPSNNPLDGIPPVDAATLAALEAANLDPDLHQMCLNRFPTQYPGVRMKTIENAAYTQLIRNERK